MFEKSAPAVTAIGVPAVTLQAPLVHGCSLKTSAPCARRGPRAPDSSPGEARAEVSSARCHRLSGERPRRGEERHRHAPKRDAVSIGHRARDDAAGGESEVDARHIGRPDHDRRADADIAVDADASGYTSST